MPCTDIVLIPVICSTALFEIPRKLRRFKIFSFLRPHAIKRIPLSLTLEHPPTSSDSRYFKLLAIRLSVLSVICLHKLKFNVVSDGSSCDNAFPRTLSVRL